MLIVEVMEFDKAKRRFSFLERVLLAAVPGAGDKVILKIGADEVIFKVYDVHYFINNSTPKLNVIRLGSLADYNSSGFSDINYYARE
jgi:hypothetical protein